MNLSRREALTLGLAATVGMAPAIQAKASRSRPIRPSRLRRGDTVAVISPAGYTSDPEDLDVVRSNLALLGLQAKIGKHALARAGYLGGTDDERAEDFNQMVSDPSVQGIVCLRGGYGTTRMFSLVDYEAFQKAPKVVWGFSDITGLLNALTRKTNVITFHGPTAASNWGQFDLESMQKVMMEGWFGEPYKPPSAAPIPSAETLVPGKVTGHLVGGNLSLLSAVGGSPYAPDYYGSVVFIEEIGEDPYRVDRMLTQLILDGSLGKAKGIVFGTLKPRANQSVSEDPKDWSMMDVLRDRATKLGLPCMTGFPTGHIADQVTLPIGAQVSLDSEARTLHLVASAVG